MQCPRSPGNHVVVYAVRSTACVAGLIVVGIVAFLVWESIPALWSVGPQRFVSDDGWQPAPTKGEPPTFNLLPMIVATMAVTAGAVLLAAPLGIASALFCRFYAPPLIAGPYRRMIELLAGIPSVVYGFWGLLVLVPLIAAWRPPGSSLLAGVLILTLMILPTVALSTEAAIANVPREYVQGAAALGLSRWTTMRSVVLPAAKSGVLTGLLLQTARALGETMAVLMVCGNVVQFPGSLFDPVRTLTANIALEMAYALDVHRSALFVSGLFLMAVVGLLVLVSDRLREFDSSVDK